VRATARQLCAGVIERFGGAVGCRVEVCRHVLEFVGQVPSAVWVVAMIANLIFAPTAWSAAGLTGRRATGAPCSLRVGAVGTRR
jgi:hypothetical protein